MSRRAVEMLGFDKIEPTLDAFYPLLHRVEPSIERRDILLKARHLDFDVPNVVTHAIELRVDRPEVNKNKVVRFVSHASCLAVPDMFRKGPSE